MGNRQVIDLSIQQQGELSLLVAEYLVSGSRVSDGVTFRSADMTMPLGDYLKGETSLQMAAESLVGNMIRSGVRMWTVRVLGEELPVPNKNLRGFTNDEPAKIPYSGKSRVRSAFSGAYYGSQENIEETIGQFFDVEGFYDRMAAQGQS